MSALPTDEHVRVFRTVEEIEWAIQKIQRRITDLELLLAPHVKFDDPAVEVAQNAIRETVLSVFGGDSIEYREFRSFRIVDSGGAAWGHTTYQRLLVESIPRGVALLLSLIERLQEKRDELSKPHIAPSPEFEGRQYGPAIVTDAVRSLYRSGHYEQAVFEAAKMLLTAVREISGEDSDGADLMRRVFSPHDPIIAFNDRLNRLDRDEQEGLMHLFEGAVLAVRNPRAHRSGYADTPRRALHYLDLLNLLGDLLRQDGRNVR